MAKTDFKSVGEYIASRPLGARLILTRVRNVIRQALPTAEEVISYQISAYRVPAGMVIFFAGWKDHFSIYPASDRVITTFKKKLARYKVSRGTIRFPLSEPMPVDLIAAIAKLRLKECAEREAAKATETGAKKKVAKKPAKKVAKKAAKTSAAKATKKQTKTASKKRRDGKKS